MEYLLKNEKLELKYEPGKGSWTYHIRIPNSKNIKGKWGDIKVSGEIDGFKFESKNLAPIKNEDKLLSINSEIRKAINKSGGELVTVTLYLENKKEEINEKSIVASFEDADFLAQFNQLSKTKQKEIFEDILSAKTEEKQIQKIIYHINFTLVKQ